MNIKYTLSFPEPHTHYLEVDLHLSDITDRVIFLKMAVWTPGSYLIREFQKNIDYVECLGENQTYRVEKCDKNTWRVNTEDCSSLHIRYRTYCFENSVRTNFVDEQHAQINGAPTFLYIEGYEHLSATVSIKPFKTWQHISTSLPIKENNPWVRIAGNLDELIDSPMEIGNHTSYFFEAAGVSHELAMYGDSNCDIEKLIHDLKKIVETEVAIFGSHPCKDYLFIIHNTDNSYGGLEHLHSSVNHITRWSYDRENYQRAISLLAHEYFHLWNIKRIRPKTLIPFNYNAENYTELLWFFEGITSYYDDYICYRAGITSREDFIRITEKNINDVLNTSGIDTQTLAEASYDTWLKYYRRNENSSNVHVNYYTHGAVVAMQFDFIIMAATKGSKSLDDVMRALYSEYLEHPEEGVTEASILRIFNAISGRDFAPYFHKYLHTTAPLDIAFYTELLGIQLYNETDNESTHLGISTQWREGKLFITQLDKQYAGYQGGLSAEDEVIAIDGFRVTKDFSKIYAHKKINDYIDVLISRQGVIQSYKIRLTADVRKSINFTMNTIKSNQEDILIKKWLRT